MEHLLLVDLVLALLPRTMLVIRGEELAKHDRRLVLGRRLILQRDRLEDFLSLAYVLGLLLGTLGLVVLVRTERRDCRHIKVTQNI